MSEFVKGAIGILTTGSMPAQFFDSTQLLDTPRGTQILRVDGWRADVARNNVVDRMLSSSAEWLFFMDSDMTFPKGALMRLLNWDKPIVGGLYFTKKDFEPVAYDFHEEETKSNPHGYFMYAPIVDQSAAFILDNKEYLPMPPRGGHLIVPIDQSGRKRFHPLLKVNGIGTGCLLIRRKVLETLKQPLFSYNEGGTEDLYFCRRAEEAGFNIFVDMGVMCGHMTQLEVSYAHFITAAGISKMQGETNGSNISMGQSRSKT